MDNVFSILHEGKIIMDNDNYHNYVLNKNIDCIYKFWYAAGRRLIMFNKMEYPDVITNLSEGFITGKTFNEYFNSLTIDKSAQHIFHYPDTIKNVFSYFFNTINKTDPEETKPFEKAIEYVINCDCVASFANDKCLRFFIFHKDEQKVYYLDYSELVGGFYLTPIELNNSMQFSSEFIENVKNIPMKVYNSFEEYFFNGVFEDLPLNENDEKTVKEIIKGDKKNKWNDFKDSGLLWFINSILHVFGWVIKYEIDLYTKEIIDAYPDRVKFRGFSEESNTKGYINLSKYMKENAEQLLKEAKDE